MARQTSYCPATCCDVFKVQFATASIDRNWGILFLWISWVASLLVVHYNNWWHFHENFSSVFPLPQCFSVVSLGLGLCVRAQGGVLLKPLCWLAEQSVISPTCWHTCFPSAHQAPIKPAGAGALTRFVCCFCVIEQLKDGHFVNVFQRLAVVSKRF